MDEKNYHGRYLGVDYGDKRTGLAVSDRDGLLAGGIGQICPGGMRHTARAVAAEAEKQGVVRIVIGLPRNMDGSEGFRALTVRAFADLLRAETTIPLDFADERLSTVEAHGFLDHTGTRGKKRKQVIDTLSAEIILQDYLDAERAAQNSAK